MLLGLIGAVISLVILYWIIRAAVQDSVEAALRQHHLWLQAETDEELPRRAAGPHGSSRNKQQMAVMQNPPHGAFSGGDVQAPGQDLRLSSIRATLVLKW